MSQNIRPTEVDPTSPQSILNQLQGLQNIARALDTQITVLMYEIVKAANKKAQEANVARIQPDTPASPITENTTEP